jgi:DNA gyrase subunit A
VLLTEGGEDIIIASSEGSAVRFTERGARTMGRTARGVIGIRLRGDDRVVGAVAVDESKHLLTITEGGYGKRTDFDNFRLMKGRGGLGVTCHNITEKTGKLAGIAVVSDNDDIMIITDSGTIIRTAAESIPVYSRTASGVIVMRLSEGQSCAGFTTVERTDSEQGEDEIGEEV